MAAAVARRGVAALLLGRRPWPLPSCLRPPPARRRLLSAAASLGPGASQAAAPLLAAARRYSQVGAQDGGGPRGAVAEAAGDGRATSRFSADGSRLAGYRLADTGRAARGAGPGASQGRVRGLRVSHQGSWLPLRVY